jgi:hypothetical protein
MTSRTAPTTEQRLEIAKEPALLAPGAELNQAPKRSISPDVGSRASKNAVIISKLSQQVYFLIEDQSLIQKLKSAEFKVKAFPEGPKRLYNRSRYRVSFDNVSTSWTQGSNY